MIRSKLSASVVGKDLVKVLENLLRFVHFHLSNSLVVYFLDVGESIDNIASAELALAHIVVCDVDGSQGWNLLQFRNLNEGEDVVVTEGELFELLKLLQSLHLDMRDHIVEPEVLEADVLDLLLKIFFLQNFQCVPKNEESSSALYLSMTALN